MRAKNQRKRERYWFTFARIKRTIRESWKKKERSVLRLCVDRWHAESQTLRSVGIVECVAVCVYAFVKSFLFLPCSFFINPSIESIYIAKYLGNELTASLSLPLSLFRRFYGTPGSREIITISDCKTGHAFTIRRGRAPADGEKTKRVLESRQRRSRRFNDVIRKFSNGRTRDSCIKFSH